MLNWVIGRISKEYFPTKAIVVLVILLNAGCNNYGFVEKLQNAGAGTGSKLYAFISSITFTSNASSLTNGGCGGSGTPNVDCSCTQMAKTAGVKMPPSGKFVAWMSDSTDAAKCRLFGSSGSTCGVGTTKAWYNMKDQMIAPDLNTMISGSLLNPIIYDETGTQTAAIKVYTGTDSTGVQFVGGGGNSCANWTGSGVAGLGVPGSTTQWSSDATPIACGTAYPFYCFALP